MGSTACLCIGELHGDPLAWAVTVVDPDCRRHGEVTPVVNPG